MTNKKNKYSLTNLIELKWRYKFYSILPDSVTVRKKYPIHFRDVLSEIEGEIREPGKCDNYQRKSTREAPCLHEWTPRRAFYLALFLRCRGWHMARVWRRLGPASNLVARGNFGAYKFWSHLLNDDVSRQFGKTSTSLKCRRAIFAKSAELQSKITFNGAHSNRKCSIISFL